MDQKKPFPKCFLYFFVLIYGGTSSCFPLFAFQEMGGGGGGGSCVSFFWVVDACVGSGGLASFCFLFLFF